MAEDLGEKTEEPTPKRKREAREEGNVAKSQDFAGVLVLALTTAALIAAAAWMLGRGKVVIEKVLDGGTVSDPLTPQGVAPLVEYVTWAAVSTTFPVLFIAWLAAGIGHLSQIGLLFSPKSIQPKLNKINPLSGFKRIFSLTSLVKAGLDALKVLAVATIAALTVVEQRERIAGLATLTAIQAFHEIGMLLIIIAWRMLLLLLILAILDLLYQKWKHHNDLKMTKQQVKDEMKQTEGDPETKKRRSRMAQQVAMQRVGAAVPQADVVVTNPEHLSIAIKYEADRMNAPRVVAKGADFLAIRIRQIATQHGIPIVERKPLARALYRDVPVGQEVPPEFYQAVAEVLAYVYRLSGKVAS